MRIPRHLAGAGRPRVRARAAPRRPRELIFKEFRFLLKCARRMSVQAACWAGAVRGVAPPAPLVLGDGVAERAPRLAEGVAVVRRRPVPCINRRLVLEGLRARRLVVDRFFILSGGGRRGVPWCRDAMAAAQGFAEARGSLGYNLAWQSRTTASMGAAQASLPAARACCDGREYRSPVWIGAVRWSTTPGSCDRALSWATCFASKRDDGVPPAATGGM